MLTREQLIAEFAVVQFAATACGLPTLARDCNMIAGLLRSGECDLEDARTDLETVREDLALRRGR